MDPFEKDGTVLAAVEDEDDESVIDVREDGIGLTVVEIKT
jgi:hypothetical protein